jgi:ABC-2 type transport system ATP-binding protein
VPYDLAAVTQDETIVSVRGLTMAYRRGLWKAPYEALRGIDLEVGRGSVFGLLGPNGAGKTTLVKVLIGLAVGYRGEARLFGERAGRAAQRARIGYLPEGHRLPGYLTGRQVLELFGQLSGRDRRWLRPRIGTWLERVGMSDSADRKLKEYSKGMQQRIGLAQALIHEPELVFLDEPTDGVDPVGRAAIREVIEEQRRRGVTVFLNSHLLMEVERMCDRVLIIDKGRVLRLGSLDDLTPRTNLVRFELEPLPSDLAELSAGLGQNLQVEGQGFSIEAEPEAIDALVDRLRARGVSIRGLSRQKLSLEATFIESVVQTSAASGGRP